MYPEIDIFPGKEIVVTFNSRSDTGCSIGKISIEDHGYNIEVNPADFSGNASINVLITDPYYNNTQTYFYLNRVFDDGSSQSVEQWIDTVVTEQYNTKTQLGYTHSW